MEMRMRTAGGYFGRRRYRVFYGGEHVQLVADVGVPAVPWRMTGGAL
jgi:hypothetical protein